MTRFDRSADPIYRDVSNRLIISNYETGKTNFTRAEIETAISISIANRPIAR